jgi:RNA polymerase sigma-70 factor, ECF subfamily
LGTEPTADLVTRAKRGERDAFEALARAYLRPAYAVALAILGRPADAEDAAQEALVAAFEKIETCREPKAFPGWLLQIARNRARNLRGSRSLREAPGGARGEAAEPRVEAVERAGQREDLLVALAALPEAQREVVLLHDLEGWTHGEIAAGAGISETMSRQHLFNARKALRATLAGHAPSGA